ncbi:MAG: type II secretion system protein M [Candidatus Saccharicenans sp.]|nr:type II secretion system protein M [Candidatus Saccharicenans sp.]
MPAFIELFDPKERKCLAGLGLTATGLVLLVVVSLFFWTYRLNAVRTEASRLTMELDRINAQNEQFKQEFRSWQQTKKDLEELETTAFYQGTEGLEAFRQDVKNLFQQSGLAVPPINYQYDENGKKQFNRMAASFAVRVSYPVLKKFLYRIETWPRLLLLDQLNFQKVDSAAGVLDLRLTLSGYYHEKTQ